MSKFEQPIVSSEYIHIIYICQPHHQISNALSIYMEEEEIVFFCLLPLHIQFLAISILSTCKKNRFLGKL